MSFPLKALAGSRKLVGAWDLASAYFYSPLAWDVSTTEPLGSLSLGVNNQTPESLFFKPDGLTAYVLDISGVDRRVVEFSLTRAWDVASGSISQAFSVGLSYGLFFKPDGTKMYICGGTNSSYVSEYDLSTAWDISSAEFLQRADFSGGPVVGARGVFFKPDGLKMYIVGNGGVGEYELSAPWDVSSATYFQVLNIGAQANLPADLFFRADGLKMYVVGNSEVYEYDLSVPWDVSSATYFQDYSLGSEPRGIFFKPDGTAFYTTVFDAGVKQYAVGVFNLEGEDLSPVGFFFKPDGTKMYVAGSFGEEINEYDLTAPWEPTSAVFVQSFSIASQETFASDVFLKRDGTKMYVVGRDSDAVHEYRLFVPWDLSTTVFVTSRSVAFQDNQPAALFFRQDGLKMYVLGGAADAVNEYDLSTAWDISSATYRQNFSVLAQVGGNPFGLFFKPDGLKMYVSGPTDFAVHEYGLGTAWDVSTAFYTESFPAAPQGTAPGLFFKFDGSRMFVGGGFNPSFIFSCNLGPQ